MSEETVMRPLQSVDGRVRSERGEDDRSLNRLLPEWIDPEKREGRSDRAEQRCTQQSSKKIRAPAGDRRPTDDDSRNCFELEPTTGVARNGIEAHCVER